jgi:hypothetical protein
LFLGHYGIAFAAKRLAPRTSLGTEQVRIFAWTALAIWLFVPWAWWVDKHRSSIARIDAGTARYPSTL